MKKITILLLLALSLSINALDKETRLICKMNESKTEYEILLLSNNTAYVTTLVDAKGNRFSSLDTLERKYSLRESPRKLTLNWKTKTGPAEIFLSYEMVIDRTSLDLSVKFLSEEMFNERGQCKVSEAKLIRKL